MDSLVDIELPRSEQEIALEQAEKLNDVAMAIFKEADRYGTASSLSMLRRALAMAPGLAVIWSNLGIVLWRSDQVVEAEYCLRKAVELTPDQATCHGNLGVFLGAIDSPQEAKKHLDEAHRLNPDDLAALWDRCLLDLRQGDWGAGLTCYDIRRKHRGPSLYPPIPAPIWEGEDLDGKTLYVQGEQGIGDRFLFGRYFSWIKEKWPTCKLKVCLHDGLHNIFWQYKMRGIVDEFLPQGIPWPQDLDYGTFICSIPEQHRSTLDNVPPDPGLLLERIQIARERSTINLAEPILPSLKVGLCWTGNVTQTRNHDRSIPLEMLLPLAEDPRLMLYSFQCSPGMEDLSRIAAGDLICDLGPQIEKEGWVATGMALMEMDLLVTVCTSVAHFAGALGVPTWTMLCADPYWVWGRSGRTTPWYPSMKLFRQKRFGDWSAVIAEVGKELQDLADQKVGPVI